MGSPAGYPSARATVNLNTVHVAMRDEESHVLALVTALAARGRVLRIEINGASLEDIFIRIIRGETAA